MCLLYRGTIMNYGVDEFGSVLGVHKMKAEIYERGPIACLINSEADEFDSYRRGIIQCDDCITYTDHVIVLAGWGVDAETNMEYWVGRNSYGNLWGEGASGGWFRIELGKNVLGIEGEACTWAVPAKDTVTKLLKQYEESL